jgi:hypothetical protein
MPRPPAAIVPLLVMPPENVSPSRMSIPLLRAEIVPE